ncbi:MAG: hypothetical protein ACFHU9_09190 [Fluviicola sp.]
MAGEIITLSEAAQMTAAWRSDFPNSTKGVKVDKEKVLDILNQEGCAGIRMYFAENSDGEKTLVLVGTDSGGNDLFNGMIVDKLSKCPNDCPDPNPLNS